MRMKIWSFKLLAPPSPFTVAHPSPSGGLAQSGPHPKALRLQKDPEQRFHLDNTKPLRSACSMPGSVLNWAKRALHCHGADFRAWASTEEAAPSPGQAPACLWLFSALLPGSPAAASSFLDPWKTAHVWRLPALQTCLQNEDKLLLFISGQDEGFRDALATGHWVSRVFFLKLCFQKFHVSSGVFGHWYLSFSPSLSSILKDFRSKIRSPYWLFSLTRENTQPVWSFVRNVPSVLLWSSSPGDVCLTLSLPASIISRTPPTNPVSSWLSATSQESFDLPRPQTLTPTSFSVSPDLPPGIPELQSHLALHSQPGLTLLVTLYV